ncbi:MAG: amidophosphoribosyltransferase [Pseudobdellovibrio sp.]
MCGVMGVYGTPFSSQEVFQGLQLLQHRGQDAAGILSYNFQSQNFSLYKDVGLVAKVFNLDNISGLTGELSIGHTRYATVGPKYSTDAKRDIQPMMMNYPFGLGMAHNGNLVNYYELKSELKTAYNRHLFTQNDLEALLNILSQNLLNISQRKVENSNQPQSSLKLKFEEFQEAVQNLFSQVHGGFSVVGALADHGLFAFRDPHGIRPLLIGRRKLTEQEKKLNPQHFEYSYCLSSETNVFQFLDYEVIGDLAPGEIILISSDGEIHSSTQYSTQNKIPQKSCMFEWIYFSNPESTLEKVNVYQSRLNFGHKLALQIQSAITEKRISPDMVVPIPDTSRVAAISLSENTHIPYREVLIKNRYVQRSFILNNQENRKKAVELKLTAISSEIKGKNVLLVDDSIVRGTTSQKIIQLVKDAGAREVYLASTCPPIRYPCFYGIDFPNPTELIAYQKTTDQIAQVLGADALFYLSENDLEKSLGTQNICKACLNGDYPVKCNTDKFKQMRDFHRT